MVPATTSPEDAERDARLKKLALETALLERQLSTRFEKLERRKANVAIVGFLAPLVAVAALVMSSYQWIEASRRAADSTVNDHIAREVDQLGSQATTARLTAVASLSSLVTERGARQRHVFQALIGDLAVDDSPLVRSAILTALKQPIASMVSKTELDALLNSALGMSRAVVRDGQLRQHRLHMLDNAPTSPAEYRAEDVASAIQILLRQGGRSRDFSETYLWGADFRHLDLQGANFDGAILTHALFDDANITRASFNNAYLDSTSFVRAQASFTRFDQAVRSDVPSNEAALPYAGNQTVDLQSRSLPGRGFMYEGPNFDCADLRNSTFRNHPLFLFLPDDLGSHGLQTTSFRGARLDDADFRTVYAIGALPRGEDTLPRDLFFIWSGGSSRDGGPWVFEASFDTDSPTFAAGVPSDATRRRFANSLSELRDSFAGAQWQHAKLPRPLRSVFRTDPPPSASNRPCVNASQ